MRLNSVQVQGFRSLRDVTLPFSRLTTLIGPNGSGKSSVLGALRLFFDRSTSVDPLDFWCGKDEAEQADVISVKIRFNDLTDAERSSFADLLDEDEGFVVERRFDGAGSGVYQISRPAVAEFSTIRRLERSHRDEYDRLRETSRFESLPPVRNKAEVFEAMAAWEGEHPEQCVLSDEEFTAAADLLGRMTFLAIGAFEQPEAHLEPDGSGAISRLVEHVVDQASVQQELDVIAGEASSRSSAILMEAAGKLAAVGESMAAMLESFAPGCTVKVDWDRDVPVRSARPRLKVDIQTADGLVRPVQYQGHGVQRSLMYAALTAALGVSQDDDHTVILVIEEPEAFQHPLSCRVLARTLRDLSARNFQIVYSTHSPDFVHVEALDGVRIVRRADPDGGGHSTYVRALSSEELLNEWRRVFEGGDYTVDSVRGRLSAHLAPDVLEGLFARACIVVEGDEDEALVRGAAAERSIDLDGAGVAVIQANGKTGIPNVLAFLCLAGIYCYPIFDLDRQKNVGGQHREAEEQILRALNIAGEVEPGIHRDYACWNENFGTSFAGDLGDAYEGLLNASAAHFGYPQPSRARKVAVVITDILARAAEAGAASPSLAELARRVEKISAAAAE